MIVGCLSRNAKLSVSPQMTLLQKDMNYHKNTEGTNILHEKLFVSFVFLWLF